MVSGCFDGLHAGHVCFLQEAAKLGDLIVVVGLDASLRLLKGKGRPIFPLSERMFMLQALRCVHRVVPATGIGTLDFEPELIALRPHFLVVNEDGDRPEKRKLANAYDLTYKVLKLKAYSIYPDRSTTQIYQ